MKREYESANPHQQKYMGSGRHEAAQQPKTRLTPRPEAGVEYNERKQTISGELPFIGRQR